MLSLPYYLATKYKEILNKSEQDKLYAQFHPLKQLLKDLGLLDNKSLPIDLDRIALLEITHPKVFKKAMKARDTLILHNQRAVIRIAQKYLNQGMCEEDLISYGQQGLIRAIWKYDPNKDIKFSSYAWLWIREEIRQGIREKNQIKHPKGKNCPYTFTSTMINPDGEETDIYNKDLPVQQGSVVDDIFTELPDDEVDTLAKVYRLDGKKTGRKMASIDEKEKANQIVERLKSCLSN